ncbi:hypothetical protein ASALC70_00691 [Alcanivorax sp. ALC70]|nr:hypothetical protein ASALC70_00691 [Alcanivorax sp. ALC70]
MLAHPVQAPGHLVQVGVLAGVLVPRRLVGAQVPLAGGGVVADRRQRLVDFMGDAGGQLAHGDQPAAARQLVLVAALLGLHHLGQTAAVFLRLDPRGDVPGHADHFHHGAGVGFADGVAGGFEPQVMTTPMADAVGHGVVALVFQGGGGLLAQPVPVLVVEQVQGGAAAQFLRPVTEQAPGRRRGVQKDAGGGVPGDQVGGVFGDQPVQAPGPVGGLFVAQLIGGVPAPGQHPGPVGHRDKGPQQDAVAQARLHLDDGPALGQAGAGQGGVVGGQAGGGVHPVRFQQRGQGPVAVQGRPSASSRVAGCGSCSRSGRAASRVIGVPRSG